MAQLFEEIGGSQAVKAAVEIFYEKVLKDERINFFFDGLDMESQRRKQILFLTYAFGGPNKYDGKGMRDAHAHLVVKGLNDQHFDAVCENLISTLEQLGVAKNHIEQVGAIAESVRSDVLGK